MDLITIGIRIQLVGIILIVVSYFVPDRDPPRPLSPRDMVGVYDGACRGQAIYRVTFARDESGGVVAHWVSLSTGRIEYVGTVTITKDDKPAYKETYEDGPALSRCTPWVWRPDPAGDFVDHANSWTLRRVEGD